MPTVGDPVPLYRNGSHAEKALLRAQDLARRAESLLEMATARLGGFVMPVPGDQVMPANEKAEAIPPFFSTLGEHHASLERTVARLETALDRLGM